MRLEQEERPTDVLADVLRRWGEAQQAAHNDPEPPAPAAPVTNGLFSAQKPLNTAPAHTIRARRRGGR